MNARFTRFSMCAKAVVLMSAMCAISMMSWESASDPKTVSGLAHCAEGKESQTPLSHERICTMPCALS